MDRKSMELLMRRMETGSPRNDDAEMRRRRRSDGTFMREGREIEYENTDVRGERYERSEQGERNTDVQNRAYAHKGPDDPNR